MKDNSKIEQSIEQLTPSMGVRNGLAYLLIGGGIGAAIALLFAPKSGSEMRAEIAEVSRKGYDATLEKVNDLSSQSSEVLEFGKQKAKAVLDLASTKLNIGKDVIADAAQASSLAAAIVDGKDNNKVDSIHTSQPSTGTEQKTAKAG